MVNLKFRVIKAIKEFINPQRKNKKSGKVCPLLSIDCTIKNNIVKMLLWE